MIVSVGAEGNLIADRLKPVPKQPFGAPEVRTGTIDNIPVAYSVSGLGKTNAAHCLTSLILNYSPSAVILFGVGGAYPDSGLGVGDVAVATKEVYADEGVLLQDGFHSLGLIGIPLLKAGRRTYFSEFPLDAVLARKMARAARSAGLMTASGVFATVSACTGTAGRAEELSTRFAAICENMEGAAVAHICRRYGLPCVEVRGISNIVEARDTSKWDMAAASENCQRTVLEFLKGLGSR
jgi:futalosine hydrolase